VAALRKLIQSLGLLTVNLGTGRGYSVLEMVEAFEKASGKSVPYETVHVGLVMWRNVTLIRVMHLKCLGGKLNMTLTACAKTLGVGSQ